MDNININIMEYLKQFYENLGNIYTSSLVAFLTGFVIGVTRFGELNILFGIIIGIIFAIIASLFLWMLYKFIPQNINFSMNVRPWFTILLLIFFFIVVTSSPSIVKVLNKLGNALSERKK